MPGAGEAPVKGTMLTLSLPPWPHHSKVAARSSSIATRELGLEASTAGAGSYVSSAMWQNIEIERNNALGPQADLRANLELLPFRIQQKVSNQVA